MKKLCAKQNRRAKQWEFSQTVRTMRKFRNAKIRNAKISQCEISQRISQCEISQCEISQRISQCEKPHCEFRNAKNHSEFRNAKFRNAKNHFAKFAMRKTILQNSQCEKPHFAMPNGCQLIAKIPALLFFQNMLQNLHKTSKIKARKIA